MHDMASTTGQQPQPLSLREHKKRQAQAIIEETALRLFQQQGYEQTSIQDIANAVQMSSRTFFRYFASKEEVLFTPMRAILSAGMSTLQQVAPGESPHAALRTIMLSLAELYQQQRTSFLIRYRVAMQIPSIASIYLYTQMAVEPAICDALSSRLESATDPHRVRFLVAIYMTALRVALQDWLDDEVQGDLISLLHGYMDPLSSTDQWQQGGEDQQ
ncbi:TetR family transcriptional regulator [Dictyobacter sp. S3.2.2.5]|uniref:TetR family transcriptional regulator n=1 Tax=Dictyobacter halimunensis TaxID=3026934 RepID=A0ABQ6G2Q6_9CHLR|nr:TetR family transcriptional regulator [Dictyobacter sp. S3.2.2.5]